MERESDQGRIRRRPKAATGQSHLLCGAHHSAQSQIHPVRSLSSSVRPRFLPRRLTFLQFSPPDPSPHPSPLHALPRPRSPLRIFSLRPAALGRRPRPARPPARPVHPHQRRTTPPRRVARPPGRRPLGLVRYRRTPAAPVWSDTTVLCAPVPGPGGAPDRVRIFDSLVSQGETVRQARSGGPPARSRAAATVESIYRSRLFREVRL